MSRLIDKSGWWGELLTAEVINLLPDEMKDDGSESSMPMLLEVPGRGHW